MQAAPAVLVVKRILHGGRADEGDELRVRLGVQQVDGSRCAQDGGGGVGHIAGGGSSACCVMSDLSVDVFKYWWAIE